MLSFSTMASLGIKLQSDLSLPENITLAQQAEARGFGSVWTAYYQNEAVVEMAVYSRATERITIGSAIIPIYIYSPAVLAMTAASLAQRAPGRIILGLGTSIDLIIDRWHGRKRAQPLRAIEENVDVIRALLRGETTTFEGKTLTIDRFSLDAPSSGPNVRIYIAALGPKMLATSGRIADGTLLNGAPFSHYPKIRAAIDAGAGDRDFRPEIAGDLRIGLGTGSQAKRIRERLREKMAIYVQMPPYNRFFTEAGYPEQAKAIKAAWDRGDRERAVRALDDDMLDEMVIVGDEATVQERLRHVIDQGLDTPMLFPWTEDEPTAPAIQRVIDVAAEVIA